MSRKITVKAIILSSRLRLKSEGLDLDLGRVDLEATSGELGFKASLTMLTPRIIQVEKSSLPTNGYILLLSPYTFG